MSSSHFPLSDLPGELLMMVIEHVASAGCVNPNPQPIQRRGEEAGTGRPACAVNAEALLSLAATSRYFRAITMPYWWEQVPWFLFHKTDPHCRDKQNQIHIHPYHCDGCHSRIAEPVQPQSPSAMTAKEVNDKFIRNMQVMASIFWQPVPTDQMPEWPPEALSGASLQQHPPGPSLARPCYRLPQSSFHRIHRLDVMGHDFHALLQSFAMACFQQQRKGLQGQHRGFPIGQRDASGGGGGGDGDDGLQSSAEPDQDRHATPDVQPSDGVRQVTVWNDYGTGPAVRGVLWAHCTYEKIFVPDLPTATRSWLGMLRLMPTVREVRLKRCGERLRGCIEGSQDVDRLQVIENDADVGTVLWADVPMYLAELDQKMERIIEEELQARSAGAQSRSREGK